MVSNANLLHATINEMVAGFPYTNTQVGNAGKNNDGQQAENNIPCIVAYFRKGMLNFSIAQRLSQHEIADHKSDRSQEGIAK